MGDVRIPRRTLSARTRGHRHHDGYLRGQSSQLIRCACEMLNTAPIVDRYVADLTCGWPRDTFR
eukprot:14598-Eustigmatos_ZCMA.PRE.1